MLYELAFEISVLHVVKPGRLLFCDGWFGNNLPVSAQRGFLSINALRACIYIYIRQLSSYRSPTLWFIDLAVATCPIQYIF